MRSIFHFHLHFQYDESYNFMNTVNRLIILLCLFFYVLLFLDDNGDEECE